MSGFDNHKSTVLVRQLRDYGWSGQWGLEPTYQQYLDHLIEFMIEVKRALKPEGTIWINLGDTYSNSGGQGNQHKQAKAFGHFSPHKVKDMPSKCLLLIPHRFAIRCIDELDLILRNDIIWAKRNGMPESVTDRFAKKHEFFFFFAKQERYYFDLDSIREKHKNSSLKRYNYTFTGQEGGSSANFKGRKFDKHVGINKSGNKSTEGNPNGKNPGDISDFWDIPTKPNPTKHYATFNSDLIDKPIIAGCPKNGIICDPFCGTGTTLFRSYELGRNFIGNDGKKEYVDDANKLWQEIKSQERLFQ
jgi:site-specific DNA-methyltransferase (cytosine-N4-specific)